MKLKLGNAGPPLIKQVQMIEQYQQLYPWELAGERGNYIVFVYCLNQNLG